MKLAFREIESFVKTPDRAARVILVYGPDAGLVAERSKTIGLSVVSDLSDPFNVVVLSTQILTDDPARLLDEANAISMMGGNRLVRVENAADRLSPLLKAYLENPSEQVLILLQAGDLGPNSSLRKLCELARNAAAIPCYIDDERDLGRFIREMMAEQGWRIDPDAVSWLAGNISGDRQKVRSELEKLLTYKGADKASISLAEAQDACGAAGAQTFDALSYAVASRDSEAALKAYVTLMQEGEPFVVCLRVLQNHFRRLHLFKARVMAGEALDYLIKNAHPKIFFKHEPAFRAQVQSWSLDSLDQALARLSALEAQCKKTHMPVETLCAQTILAISRSKPAR